MTQSKQAAVAVVLLNWNGWQYTIEACRSLMEFGGPGLKIIVVDNASTDGSVAHLRSKLPQVELIVNDVNIGFAAGCNVGIRRALDAGCEFCLSPE